MYVTQQVRKTSVMGYEMIGVFMLILILTFSYVHPLNTFKGYIRKKILTELTDPCINEKANSKNFFTSWFYRHILSTKKSHWSSKPYKFLPPVPVQPYPYPVCTASPSRATCPPCTTTCPYPCPPRTHLVPVSCNTLPLPECTEVYPTPPPLPSPALPTPLPPMKNVDIKQVNFQVPEECTTTLCSEERTLLPDESGKNVNIALLNFVFPPTDKELSDDEIINISLEALKDSLKNKDEPPKNITAGRELSKAPLLKDKVEIKDRGNLLSNVDVVEAPKEGPKRRGNLCSYIIEGSFGIPEYSSDGWLKRPVKEHKGNLCAFITEASNDAHAPRMRKQPLIPLKNMPSRIYNPTRKNHMLKGEVRNDIPSRNCYFKDLFKAMQSQDVKVQKNVNAVKKKKTADTTNNPVKRRNQLSSQPVVPPKKQKHFCLGNIFERNDKKPGRAPDKDMLEFERKIESLKYHF